MHICMHMHMAMAMDRRTGLESGSEAQFNYNSSSVPVYDDYYGACINIVNLALSLPHSTTLVRSPDTYTASRNSENESELYLASI